jgi:hypothetical protein
MNYVSYSDDELMDAYDTMMDFSGKISDDLQSAIDQRGGLEKFKRQIANKGILQAEIKRISDEIFSLANPETNIDFVRKMVSSTILSETELDLLVENKFKQYQAYKKDKEVSVNTIVKSLIGTLAGMVVGGILWALLVHFLGDNLFYLLIPIYIVNYFIIKLIAKQTRANPVVFVACFISTAGSVMAGYYLLAYFS